MKVVKNIKQQFNVSIKRFHFPSTCFVLEKTLSFVKLLMGWILFVKHKYFCIFISLINTKTSGTLKSSSEKDTLVFQHIRFRSWRRTMQCGNSCCIDPVLQKRSSFSSIFACQATCHCLNQCCLVYWRICAVLGFDELIVVTCIVWVLFIQCSIFM